MEYLKAIFDACVSIFKLPFTVFGFELSWWNILLWSAIAGIVIWLIVRFVDG